VPRCSRRDLLRLAGAAGLAAFVAPGVRAQSPAPSPTPPRSPAPAPSSAPSPGRAPAGPSIALLLPRATGDQGAADDLAAAMDRAHAQLGYDARIVTATDPATWGRTLARLIEDGTDLVIAAFPETAAAIDAAAIANPAARFLHVDGNPDAPDLPNLTTIVFDTHEAWYLAGLLAADVSQTRQVGYVGAVADDAHHAAGNALAAGAAERDPDVVVDRAFVPVLGDAAAGVDLAVDQLGLGADVIAAAAGPSDPAIVATAQQTGTWAIVGFEALAAAAPDTVLATVAVLRGQALLDALGAAIDGTRPGTRHAGLVDGYVELVVNEAFLASGPGEVATRLGSAQDLVNDARAAILDGTLTVRRDTSPPPR
jgi:basic membrane protein A